jgi:hypothetical protein
MIWYLHIALECRERAVILAITIKEVGFANCSKGHLGPVFVG